MHFLKALNLDGNLLKTSEIFYGGYSLVAILIYVEFQIQIRERRTL